MSNKIGKILNDMMEKKLELEGEKKEKNESVISDYVSDAEEDEEINIREKFEEALEDFENQYNVELRSTGHYQEDDVLIEEEYWVEGLVESPVLSIRVGGWFRFDMEYESVSCMLGVMIEGDDIFADGSSALLGEYRNGRWELEVGML